MKYTKRELRQMGMPTSPKEAVTRAAWLTDLHKRPWISVELPSGTEAYEMGLRYANIEEVDRQSYIDGGAKVIEA